MSNRETWEETKDSLQKTFEFKDFEDAMQFMQMCIQPIQELNHHPTWSNVYNKVHVSLQTHDAGNIVTKKDKDLSVELDKVFKQMNA